MSDYTVSPATETRLRRLARGNGCSLHLSRQARGADNHGGFQIRDPACNMIVAGERFDLTPDEVEGWFR